MGKLSGFSRAEIQFVPLSRAPQNFQPADPLTQELHHLAQVSDEISHEAVVLGCLHGSDYEISVFLNIMRGVCIVVCSGDTLYLLLVG